MEIGLVYSSKDPRHLRTREFIRKFVADRGILARFVESDEPVQSPTVVVDGHELKDLRQKPRTQNAPLFPDLKVIARVLEQRCWCL